MLGTMLSENSLPRQQPGEVKVLFSISIDLKSRRRHEVVSRISNGQIAPPATDKFFPNSVTGASRFSGFTWLLGIEQYSLKP
jgi:hypothetical protein